MRVARLGNQDTRRPARTNGCAASAKSLGSSAPIARTVASCPLTDDVIRWHLCGEDEHHQPFVAGVYPLLPDESCYLLAADFDKAEVRDQPGYGHESRALMLVRGQDRTGRNNFERGHARINA